MSILWPLFVVLFVLLVLWRLEKEVKPVVTGVMTGLANNAKQKALLYAMGALYFLAASLQALGEVSTQFEWVHIAAFAKVIQPGIVAIIAYVTKPPQVSQVTPNTAPPFTPPAP